MSKEEILKKVAHGELPITEASKLLEQIEPPPRRRDAQRGKSEAERELYEGIDDDIEELFFNLDARSIELMFRHYERDHGRTAHDYAVKTYREWKGGRVRVSGKVADRLVAIVPHYITWLTYCCGIWAARLRILASRR